MGLLMASCVLVRNQKMIYELKFFPITIQITEFPLHFSASIWAHNCIIVQRIAKLYWNRTLATDITSLIETG